ncbi:RIO1 family regulatory kinase/ATPase [Zwartia sp.]|uniref:RIO1 family regulatory kinase/ATPase domain-containing protein n=1 Tax=Zwartia sp. TaxID=2978004 RepID=UPI002722F4A3|nr:RIO1 family regulatory kinase/ATPase [Zwartia sp.]MDO9023921.1 RIO1 family regulatory kinase/ATPase [Zwartia sp.]
MTHSDPRFLKALSDWLAQHTSLTHEVSVVELAGRLCVIKIKRPSVLASLSYGVRYLRASLISLLCWWGFKERPSARVLLRNGVEDETERLLALHDRHYPAPEVLYYGPGVLVLDYVGENLPTILRESAPEDRLKWMTFAAQDLAAFHQAGFVHGGAQLRNLMVQGEQITRIDFEENIGEALSRPLGQAYDVYQMMSSMAGLRGEQFSEQERRLLCDRLLEAYLAANPDAEVRAQLSHLGKLFAGVQKYTAWLLQRLPGRDVRGFLYVSDALRL